MDVQAQDAEAMIRAAVSDLEQRFGSCDRPRIEATVQRLVREWLSRARVKTFVGIIAQRHARAELELLIRSSGAGDGTTGPEAVTGLAPS